MLITSIQNEKIKSIKNLNDKKYRDESKVFLIEGEHLVQEAFKNGYLKTLILEENYAFDLDIETLIVSRQVMTYISKLDNPPKVMGICNKLVKKDYGKKLLLLDEIQDPGNLGTIIRSAVAFNIDTIVLGNNCVDLYNSKVIRSTQGMIFNINLIEEDLEYTINNLKEKGFKIIGTKVNGGKNLKNVEKYEKFAIIMGNEGNGVKNSLIRLCDDYIYINMNYRCESLNVAVATSIIIYELDK